MPDRVKGLTIVPDPAFIDGPDGFEALDLTQREWQLMYNLEALRKQREHVLLYLSAKARGVANVLDYVAEHLSTRAELMEGLVDSQQDTPDDAPPPADQGSDTEQVPPLTPKERIKAAKEAASK